MGLMGDSNGLFYCAVAMGNLPRTETLGLGLKGGLKGA